MATRRRRWRSRWPGSRCSATSWRIPFVNSRFASGSGGFTSAGPTLTRPKAWPLSCSRPPKHALTFFSAIGLMHAGWARAAGAEAEAGIAMMHEADRLFRAAGQRVGFAFWARLAEVLIGAGRVDDARRVIADAVRLMGGTPRG